MPVNREAVEVIKRDILKHANRYNQDRFGRETECGTVMCLAGFCRVHEIGLKKFRKEIAADADGNYFDIEDLCTASGKKLFGIKSTGVPQIFLGAGNWPEDLYERYEDAKTNKERALLACEALDRLRVNGSIGPPREK